MNRSKFYAALRKRESGVFGTSLSQAQVDGTNAILDSCIRNKVKDAHHVSNILSQVYKETGGYMLGIKETVFPSHKNKNPSDATVIQRLDRAWAKGQLKWVSSPYWREGWFGRGPIQTTHKFNYEKMGKALGVDLIKHPEKLLEPKTGADSAVVGMSEGLYTGKKLSDYSFPDCLTAAPKRHPRRIVNGQDGTDVDITSQHWSFHRALEAGGWTGEKRPSETPAQERNEAPVNQTPPDRENASQGKYGPAIGIGAALAGIAALVAAWFGFGG